MATLILRVPVTRRLPILVSLVILAAATMAYAADGSANWYVTTDGSDETGDGTYEQPFATVGRGLLACSTDDTLRIGAGTYSESDLAISVPMTIRALDNIDPPTIDGGANSHVFLVGTGIDGVAMQHLIITGGHVSAIEVGWTSVLNLDDCQIDEGTGVGIGIYEAYDTIVEMTGGQISGRGEAAVFSAYSGFRASNGYFSNNAMVLQQTGDGPGASFQNCLIEHNTELIRRMCPAKQDDDLAAGGTRLGLILDSCTFVENTGGIDVCAQSLEIVNCQFIDNTTDNSVSLIYQAHVGNVSIVDCDILGTGGTVVSTYGNADPVIISNTIIAGGTGDHVIGSHVGTYNLDHVTIVDNDCDVLATPSHLIHHNWTNTIVVGNNGDVIPDFDPEAPFVIDADCCDIFGNSGGDWVDPIAHQLGQDGNISAAPLFCDPSAGVYTLNPNSPCTAENSACGLMGSEAVGDCAMTTWYVATDGDDENGNGSLEMPYATIGRGLLACQSGDTLMVATGTYEETDLAVGNEDEGYVCTIRGFDSLNPPTIVADFELGDAGGPTVISIFEDLIIEGSLYLNTWGDLELNGCQLIGDGGPDHAIETLSNAGNISMNGGRAEFWDGVIDNRTSGVAAHGVEFRHNTGFIVYQIGRGRSGISFSNCLFEENSAGIYAIDPIKTMDDRSASNRSFINIDNCEFKQNAGSIYSNGYIFPVSVSDCDFRDSHCSIGPFFNGSVVDCTFERSNIWITNTSVNEGAVSATSFTDCSVVFEVYAGAGRISVSGSTFSRCTGRLFIGDLALNHVTITDHEADHLAIAYEIEGYHATSIDFDHVTIANLSGTVFGPPDGSTNHVWTNSIIAFGSGQIFDPNDDGDTTVSASCCDIFGNAGGDWIGPLAGQLGQDGNISADPLFCDASSGDYTLSPLSPCAPENSEDDCGQIGANGVGDCGANGVDDSTPQPTSLAIVNCYPNPFNPQTTIEFTVPVSSGVRLRLYDVQGRLVRSLVDEIRPVGSYDVVWDGRDGSGRSMSSGTYFARLEQRAMTSVKSLVLVR